MFKQLVFIVGFFVSSGVCAANWAYVVSGGNQNFFIDKDFYKYDARAKTVEVWIKSTKTRMLSDEYYTASKTLIKYSCPNKTSKTLASINYDMSGDVLKSSTKPSGNFSVIFPDSIDEAIWEVSCLSKGKGLALPKYDPEFVDLKSVGIN